jgi:hypothetical protein
MNEKKTSAEYPPIRMLFELDRADDPFLYDDLMRCRKGSRRANRLRLLAHEGVSWQWSLAAGLAPRLPAVAAPVNEVPPLAAEIAMPLAADVFGAPIAEG